MNGRTTFRWKPFVLAVLLGLTACNSTNSARALPVGVDLRESNLLEGGDATANGKIKHVIIIVQENRSVDNLFQGFPGADTRPYGYGAGGTKIKLQPIPLEARYDIDHSLASYMSACDGQGALPGTKCKMDGFGKEAIICPFGCPKNPEYGYVPQSETVPYFTMGKQYVFADHMFTSMIDASSFTSHQYIIAGQSNSSVDFPSSLWGCGGGQTDVIATLTQQRTVGPTIPVCFNDQTLGDELDAAHLTWGYYTSALDASGYMWSAYRSIRHIRYGPDWKDDVFSPQSKFLKLVEAGQLPNVTWITPTCRNSDHANCDSNHGPAWVTSLVNAVGESKYWKSSAIFIFWDEYGGWYDHVAPKMLDYDGLGLRVPLLVISPYAKKGYVSHVQYEHGSILKFVEDQFGLARLAASDTRATSPQKDCFDFSQPPRPFTPIASPFSKAYFEKEPPDPRPVDTE
jgi:phospholipase C